MSEPIDRWELAADSITLQIRWFGLFVGFALANLLAPPENRGFLNGILLLGAVYAILDVIWHQRGQIFLGQVPLFTVVMEALFIGVLCYFDYGLDSAFRFYYFLSLVVCAMRYSSRVTYSALGVHTLSLFLLAAADGITQRDVLDLVLLLTFLGWATWASTALASLLRSTGEQLSGLNTQLESRIRDRTRELQESQALLVQQEKQAAFGLLAAGIAHEVGNPLAAISALVQMMNRKSLEPEMHERLGLVDEQLRRIQRTLQELVQFSRPAAKNSVLCDVHAVVNQALEIAKYYKRKKGKTILTEFAPQLPPVWFVQDQLLQVFLNLILNSLEATEEGGHIRISTRLNNGRVEILISDSGQGIREADQSRLFQPYFTTKETGTGLGLFVCHNILTAAGGDISLVESSPAGTTFMISVPASTALPGGDQGLNPG
jgi:signal transduction histidine kinase